MMLPLQTAISVHAHGRRIRAHQLEVRAELLGKALAIVDQVAQNKTPTGMSVVTGFSGAYIRTWLKQAEVETIHVFIDAHARGTLPSLNAFTDILMPVAGICGLPSEMLLREVLEYHHLLEYDDAFDMHEVVASVAAVHAYKVGREHESWAEPGTPQYDEDLTIFLLSYALRYCRNMVTRDHHREHKFNILFPPTVPIYRELVDFARSHPDRIHEIREVCDERPDADGATVVAILSAPSQALREGVL